MGKLLAGKLGRPFIDTDSLLVSESGTSIKEIVAEQGWEGFRRIEHDILKQVCLIDRQVVATGGGIVLNDANVNRMKKNGKLVWLKAKPKTIKNRMSLDQDTEAYRPSLTSNDIFNEIEDMLIERNPINNQAMDFFVDTDVRNIDDICDEIVRQLL